MNRLFPSWHAVAQFLAQQPPRSVLRLEKYQIGHPSDAGMTLSLGLPLGQASDWRFCSPQCGGLHVRDFGAYYAAHLDQINPRCDTVAHVATDTPQLAGGLALGALVGAAFGKSKEATLVGAMVGGLLGLAATVSAADKAEKRGKLTTSAAAAPGGPSARDQGRFRRPIK